MTIEGRMTPGEHPGETSRRAIEQNRAEERIHTADREAGYGVAGSLAAAATAQEVDRELAAKAQREALYRQHVIETCRRTDDFSAAPDADVELIADEGAWVTIQCWVAHDELPDGPV